MLVLDEVSREIDGVPVVPPTTLACRPGTLTALVEAPTGGTVLPGHGTALAADTSTLLRIAAGLTRPDHGKVWLGGQDLALLPCPARFVGSFLGGAWLDGSATGRAALRDAVRVLRQPLARAAQLWDLTDLSGPRSRDRLRRYSVDERLRLGVAVALAGDPRALVLDEPLTGVSAEADRWLHGVLDLHLERGGVVLCSAAANDSLARRADRVVGMVRPTASVPCVGPARMPRPRSDRQHADSSSSDRLVGA